MAPRASANGGGRPAKGEPAGKLAQPGGAPPGFRLPPAGEERTEDAEGFEEMEDSVDLEEDPFLPGPSSGPRQPFKPTAIVNIQTPTEGEISGAVGRVTQLWENALRIGHRAGVDPTPAGDFGRQMQSAARPMEQFRSGLLGESSAVWRHYFSLANGDNPLSKDQRRILGMISEGVRFKWQGAPPGGPEATPKQRKKKAIVTQMLRQAVPGCDPEAYLTGPTPRRVQFPNHSSAEEYADFVTAELEKCLQIGAVAEWTADLGEPVVVNGLRVVVSAEGAKLRLCMNPMYPNLFLGDPAAQVRDHRGPVRVRAEGRLPVHH